MWKTSSTEGTGSGCSAYDAKPTWQTDTGCAKRMIADVSAVADPATGVSVYDTYGDGTGWVIYGGTSASVADHRGASTPWPAPRAAATTRRRTPTRGRHLRAQRRDRRQQRHLLHELLLHRQVRLRRPDRLGHPRRA